jgi:hypothetical protein
MSHPMTATYAGNQPAARRKHPNSPAWPSFKGQSQLVGTSSSGKVTVYVDSTLGAQGLQNAHDLLADADRVVNANNAIFGTPGGPVNVIVFALGGNTDGSGGADHMGCDYTSGANIEACASFGNSARVSALFEAELSECSMGGNLCGRSTGEGLSRWCAAEISNNALSDFATAPQWDQDGRPNYVDKTDPTDQDADSTGCTMAFLSWLMSQGHALDKIAPAMVSLGDSGTLAQLYSHLTGNPASSAWQAFQAAVQSLHNGITDDDPFGGASHADKLTGLTPNTVALAGKVFSAILADIAAGKTANQLVASVQSVMATSSASNGAGMSGAACEIRSRRLLPPHQAQAHYSGN